MTRPRLLDLFCGAGGAAMGYHRAGFEVLGIDIEPQPHYPFTVHQADAMEVLEDPYFLRRFDAIHASPPCQAYSTGAPGRTREDHPDLLGPVRDKLRQICLPFVIENVPNAPMPNATLFCGATFYLPVIRHRLFETSWELGLVPNLCPQKSWQRGTPHAGRYGYGHGSWAPHWRKHVLPEVWPWMTLAESGQAIPPAYTEYIGKQLLEHLSSLRTAN